MLSEEIIQYLKKSGFDDVHESSGLPGLFRPSFIRTDICDCCKRSATVAVYSDGSFDAYDERVNEMFAGGVKSIESVDDMKLIIRWIFHYR